MTDIAKQAKRRSQRRGARRVIAIANTMCASQRDLTS